MGCGVPSGSGTGSSSRAAGPHWRCRGAAAASGDGRSRPRPRRRSGRLDHAAAREWLRRGRSRCCSPARPKHLVATPRRVGTLLHSIGMGRVVQNASRASRSWSDQGSQAGGTSRAISSSQRRGPTSEGIRQSPRGDREPPGTTFGPFGRVLRLNWFVVKRRTKTSSQ